MNDIPLIERLIKFLEDSDVESIEIKRGWFSTRVKVSKGRSGSEPVVVRSTPVAPGTGEANPGPAAEAAAPEAPPELLEIKSPMVGTFYRGPEPGAELYVDEGARVKPGRVVCIIEAMKIMNEIEAEVTGVIREICVEDAQSIEFGQVLFRVDPNG